MLVAVVDNSGVVGSGDEVAAGAAAYSMLVGFSWTTAIIWQGNTLFDWVQLNATNKRKRSATPRSW